MPKIKDPGKEKGRPERHTGNDDVAFDRSLRTKKESSKDEGPGPVEDTTAPGDNGTAPSDMRVATPRKYKDPWIEENKLNRKIKPPSVDES